MNRPSGEARLLAQEELTALLHAQIKQVSLDLQAGLGEVKATMKASFNEIGTLFDRNFERFAAIEGRLDRIESDVRVISTAVQEILARLPEKGNQ